MRNFLIFQGEKSEKIAKSGQIFAKAKRSLNLTMQKRKDRKFWVKKGGLSRRTSPPPKYMRVPPPPGFVL